MKLLFNLFILFILPVLLFSQSSYTNVQIVGTGGPNELTICVNPKNTNQLYAGSNINKYWYSSNGGLNWSATQTLVSNPYGVWGDLCVIVDTTQSWYIFHLANNPNLPWPAIDRMVCQKATTFGGSFSNPGTYMLYNPPKLHDKEWACVDWTHGPHGNWVYCTWTQFDTYLNYTNLDSTHILFGRSTDGGLTWTAVQRINKKGGNCADGDYTVEGAVPTVGPNGEVYVVWSGPNGTNDFKIFFDKSTDGGVTWLANDLIVANQPGGWDFPIAGIQRSNGMPISCCDISNGPYRGYIYVNWVDEVSGTDHDVKFSRSTNGGLNWSAPLRVNNDAAGKEQFFTWMSLDQKTGIIYMVFYDRRNYTDNNTDVYMAKSTDGGNTFTNERISASPFVPTSNVFFGDYINISATNGRVRPIWMRLQSGTLSAWTALIDFPVGVEQQTEIPVDYSLSQNYPNPFNPSTNIKFDLPSDNNVQIKVYDLLGKEVATLVNGRYSAGSHEINWDASDLSSGVYIYKMITSDGKFSQTKKMLLVK